MRSIRHYGRIADFRCGREVSVQLKKKRTFNVKILCGSSESRFRADCVEKLQNLEIALFWQNPTKWGCQMGLFVRR